MGRIGKKTRKAVLREARKKIGTNALPQQKENINTVAGIHTASTHTPSTDVAVVHEENTAEDVDVQGREIEDDIDMIDVRKKIGKNVRPQQEENTNIVAGILTPHDYE